MIIRIRTWAGQAAAILVVLGLVTVFLPPVSYFFATLAGIFFGLWLLLGGFGWLAQILGLWKPSPKSIARSQIKAFSETLGSEDVIALLKKNIDAVEKDAALKPETKELARRLVKLNPDQYLDNFFATLESVSDEDQDDLSLFELLLLVLRMLGIEVRR